MSDDKTDAKIINMPDFELSQEAKAAGIDGKVKADLTIGVDGKVSSIKIYGSQMWPCGNHPNNEIENVIKAVKLHLASLKFQPATKKRKAKIVRCANYLLAQ